MKLHLASLALPSLFVSAATATAAPQFLHEFQGSAPGDEYGAALDGGQDVNGDGLDDLVIGSPEYGAGLGLVEVRSGADGSLLWSHTGGMPLGRLGWSVALVGDADGDGRADVLVGARWDGTGAPAGGAVRLYSGASGLEIFSDYGTMTSDQLGQAVAGVGDWNGDGRGDYAYSSLQGGTSTVWVRSGADASLLLEVNGDPGDYTGYSLCALDDLNSDGVPELVVAEPYDDTNGHNRGRVRVLSGADGAELDVVYGLSDSSYFGLVLATLGDVDGDGVRDLGVGAPNDSQFGNFSGAAVVLSGADRSTIYTYLGDGWGQLVGSSICGAGDLDLDGFDDFGVGMSGDHRMEWYSGATGEWLYWVTGQSGDGTGATLAYAGDMNGDGLPDTAIASPGWNQRGRVRVASGAWGVFHLELFCRSGEEGVACPCGNDDPLRGCINSTGGGSYLGAAGSTSASADDLQLVCYFLPPGQPALLFVGDARTVGANPFGDGLRCVVGSITRLGLLPSTIGAGSWGPGLGTLGGWSAGENRYFQVWYRDPAGPCGNGTNLSSALRAHFLP